MPLNASKNILSFLKILIAASIIPDFLRLDTTLFCPGLAGIYKIHIRFEDNAHTPHIQIELSCEDEHNTPIDRWYQAIPTEAPNRVDAIMQTISSLFENSLFPLLYAMDLSTLSTDWKSDITPDILTSPMIRPYYIARKYPHINPDAVTRLSEYLANAFPNIPVTNIMVMSVLQYWTDDEFYIID